MLKDSCKKSYAERGVKENLAVNEVRQELKQKSGVVERQE